VRDLTDNTGKGQLEILSVLARDSGLRHSDIYEASTLSKGAVTNNLEKLRDKSLIRGDTEISVNSEKLIELYREHLEEFLIREQEEPSELNQLRTEAKRNMPEIIAQEEIEKTMLSVLENSQKRSDLESLNSVFKETDRIFRETGDKTELRMIGLITDKSNGVTDNSEIAEEAQKILNEVKE